MEKGKGNKWKKGTKGNKQMASVYKGNRTKVNKNGREY